MEYAVIERPATYDDIKAVPLPNGLAMDPTELSFQSEQCFSEHARAVEKDGQVIAVFGVKPQWPGVGHCFGYIDKDAHRHPKTLFIMGRLMIERVIETFDFWRLQATVDVKFDRGVRYLLKMGFNVDGLMPKFGPDRSDHLMMSRILDD